MSWVERLKPGAAARVHLLLAGLMWALVGAALVGFGGWWLWQLPTPAAPWLVALALVIGVFKARFVLDRVARGIVDRILERGDGRCLGGFLSVRSWALVAVMVVGGRILRGSHMGRGLLGVLYVAVGTALLLSSRVAWRAWREARDQSSLPSIS
jgi:Ni/Fe-hydrogenase subunit HybB-like protein